LVAWRQRSDVQSLARTAHLSSIGARSSIREVALVAFDLLELNGEDVRPQPLIQRETWLEKLVSKVRDGIEFSEHLEGDGTDIFRAACRLGHEGVVAPANAISVAMTSRVTGFICEVRPILPARSS
jgi:ATP-dependent DNA ligase